MENLEKKYPGLWWYEGKPHPTLGKHIPKLRERFLLNNPSKRPEVRQKISETLKGRKLSEEVKHKISLGGKGLKRSDETKIRISNARKGIKFSDEHKKNLSEAMQGRQNWKGLHHSEEAKRKMSLAKKGIRPACGFKKGHKFFDDKVFKEKQMKATLEAMFKRPTALEKDMIGIFEKHKLPYKYTGDGSFLIGFRNPDFVNMDGLKLCIEIGNTFHHKNNYSEERIEHFKKYGWYCLVFLFDRLNDRSYKIDEDKVISEIHQLQNNLERR